MDAVFEDIINAFNEEAECTAFVSNTSKLLGKGPTVLAKRLTEHRELHSQANSIIDAFHQGCLDADIMKHTDPDRYFIASKSAKHRVPKSFPQNNPTQDGAYAGKGKGYGKTSDPNKCPGGCGCGGQGRNCDTNLGTQRLYDDVVLIEDEPIKSTHGKGRGRGRGKTRLAGKENTYYTATSVEDQTGVMKCSRGRGRGIGGKGRGGRGGGVGGGNGRGDTTHYVSDSDDDSVPAVTLIEEGTRTGKQPGHRPQVIDSSDDEADEGEGQNEVQPTASTSRTVAPTKRGGRTQRNFDPI